MRGAVSNVTAPDRWKMSSCYEINNDCNATMLLSGSETKHLLSGFLKSGLNIFHGPFVTKESERCGGNGR